jgi:FkbM family methyltransferase
VRGAAGLLRGLLRRAGIDVVRWRPVPHHLARRAHLLGRLAPDLVLDVGASTGIYARELRALGWAGRIVSFEPQSAAHAALAAAAAADPRWEAVRLGLGAEPGAARLHLAGNSWSSSLRRMTDAHLSAAPESRGVGEETVEMETLDRVWDRFVRPGERVWLKVDTQGHERDVLDGAAASLPRVRTLQLEMSPVELYEGEMLFVEMYERVVRAGFACVHLEPGLVDPATERLLSLDGYFHRLDEPEGEGRGDG